MIGIMALQINIDAVGADMSEWLTVRETYFERTVTRMRLIDKDALMKTLDIKDDCGDCEYENGFFCSRNSDFVNACEAICDAPTIVEFEGDINKVIVKGEEYHKQLTTTWLGDYSPYQCKHCGYHVDSKTRFCPDCGRRASNYD